MLEEYDDLKDNACYRLDLMDFARQLAAEKGRKYLKKFADAYKTNDRELFNQYTKSFLELFDSDDHLMSTNSRTRLDTWLKRAEDYAEEEKYKDAFRFNAKNLLVLWASKEGAVVLRDYAYREWNGMIPHYKTRWEMYIKELSDNFGIGDGSSIDWANIDYKFVMDKRIDKKHNNYNLRECVKKIINEE